MHDKTKHDDMILESNSMNDSDQKSKPSKIKIYTLVAAAIIILALLIIILLPRPDISFAVESIPEIVEPGEEFVITSEVMNSGRAAGSYLLVLSVDGSETETQEINISPGEKELISFSIANNLAPGKYQIGLNEWVGEVQVLKPAEFHIENFSLKPDEVQINQETTVSAEIINKGEVAGTYEFELLFDGETIINKELNLAGDTSETFSYKISKENPGFYKVAINGHSNNLKVLKPANIEVSDLTISPTSVKPGQSVKVTVVANNSGEVAGDHDLSLSIGGKEEQSKMITVPGNAAEQVSFDISRDSAGHYTVTCDDVSETFTVMKIERPANGAILTRSMASGEGELVIKNSRDQDALVALTGVNEPNNTLLAVYVRSNSATTVRNIADRTYDVYFTHGNDWDKFSNQFTENISRMKFREPLKFTTTSTQYTIWEITVHAVVGGTAAIDNVSPDDFPKF